MHERWRRERLPDLVRDLAARPGHERLRVLLQELLREAFGADFAAIEHEVRLTEVRGRADMLFGATVIELETDLRRERPDVEARLPDYLAEREQRTGRRYLGLATDGATFLAFERRAGKLVAIGRHETDPKAPEAVLAWLEPALSDRDDIPPDPLRVRRELGRDSLTWARARTALEGLWARLRDHPEVAVERGLWDGLLREAYGAAVGDDALFLQHTYLTVVAKTPHGRRQDAGRPGSRPAGRGPRSHPLRPRARSGRHPRRRGERLLRLAAARARGSRPRRPHRPPGPPLPPPRPRGGRLEGALREPDRTRAAARSG